jgi:hypothetical protein
LAFFDGQAVALNLPMRTLVTVSTVVVLWVAASAVMVGQVAEQVPASQQSVPSQFVSPQTVFVGHGPEVPDVAHRATSTFVISVVVLAPSAPVEPSIRDSVTTITTAGPSPGDAVSRGLASFPAGRAMSIGSLYPPPAAAGGSSPVDDCRKPPSYSHNQQSR